MDVKWIVALLIMFKMVTSLIEGRIVSLDEIYHMLNSILRQHSIDCAEKNRFMLALALRKSPREDPKWSIR